MDDHDARQSEVRAWWTAHPMTYDWDQTIAAEPGSAAYLEEVERRFLTEAWFAQDRGAPAFSGLVDFDAVNGKDVLEIGCGTGVHARLFAAAGANLTAVDLTPTAVQLTRRRLELSGLTATVLECDAEQLPFEDASFDAVWSWGVIHHSARTERVIEEIARVLRPGGTVSLMVYNRSSITYWFNYMFIRGVLGGRLMRESPAKIADRYSDGAVARHFTRAELANALEPWFANVDTRVFGQIGEAVPLPASLRRRVEPFLPLALRKRIVRRWGWFLYATARRR